MKGLTVEEHEVVETVSISEAARMLEVTDKTIRNYIKRGFFVPKKWNGMWQISKKEVREIYRKKTGLHLEGATGVVSSIGVSKDEYSEQMIGLGKVQAYEVHLKDQKDEIEKLNTRIVQLEASSASGWTEARSGQLQIQGLVDEVTNLRDKERAQSEELAWLRREKDLLARQSLDQEIASRKLVLKLKGLEDQLHLLAISG
ncbi:MAG: helix-turn-helix domain-containing protein [Candidatus Latescibacteria bacterium]|nr:helix-turn-helix domain-containing protein [Candidatus Latescibacterota bacterium]